MTRDFAVKREASSMSGSESASVSACEIIVSRRTSGLRLAPSDADTDSDAQGSFDSPGCAGQAKATPYGGGRLFVNFEVEVPAPDIAYGGLLC